MGRKSIEVPIHHNEQKILIDYDVLKSRRLRLHPILISLAEVRIITRPKLDSIERPVSQEWLTTAITEKVHHHGWPLHSMLVPGAGENLEFRRNG